MTPPDPEQTHDEAPDVHPWREAPPDCGARGQGPRVTSAYHDLLVWRGIRMGCGLAAVLWGMLILCYWLLT